MEPESKVRMKKTVAAWLAVSLVIVSIGLLFAYMTDYYLSQGVTFDTICLRVVVACLLTTSLFAIVKLISLKIAKPLEKYILDDTPGEVPSSNESDTPSTNSEIPKTPGKRTLRRLVTLELVIIGSLSFAQLATESDSLHDGFTWISIFVSAFLITILAVYFSLAFWEYGQRSVKCPKEESE